MLSHNRDELGARVIPSDGAKRASSRVMSQIYDGGDKIALMHQLKGMEATAFSDVLEAASFNKTILAFLALYPRFINGRNAKEFYRFVEQGRAERLKGDVPYPLQGMSDGDLRVILPNVDVIQNTWGCSQSCSFCDVAAPLPRVDGEMSLEHMPLSQLEGLAGLCDRLGVVMDQQIMGYWASDPMDNPDVVEIQSLLRDDLRQGGASITTHLPEGVEDRLQRLMMDGVSVRISVTARNLERVRSFVRDKVSPEILNAAKLPDSLPGDNSKDFNLKLDPSLIFPGYLDVRSASASKQKGLGASLMKPGNVAPDRAYGCQTGVMITPLGIYSKLHGVSPTKEYPFGDVLVPLDGLMPIGDVRMLIGRPLDLLLKYTVPYSHYGENVSESNRIRVSVIDGDNRYWVVDAFNLNGSWIISGLEPYRRRGRI